MRRSDEIDGALKQIRQLAGEVPGNGTAPARRRPRRSERRRPSDRSGRGRRIAGTLIRWGVVPLGLLVLPFAVLIRGSVFVWSVTLWPVTAAIGAGAAGAGVTLFVAVRVLLGRLHLSLPRYSLQIALMIAAAFCTYALLYVSADNVKHAEIRETYSTLHPLLRLPVSTLVLFDAESVLTDTDRHPEDYRRMGLPPNEGSLHLVQDDGYAHAFDLRTTGRSEWRNRLTQAWFSVMGFRTLRHVGTADHLHVSLAPRGG